MPTFPIEFESYVLGLCLSPGGTRLAIMNESAPGEVLVIQFPSGKEIARFSNLEARPKAAFRSENGLFIVHGANCWLCDLRGNTHRTILEDDKENRGDLRACLPSSNGKTVLIGGGGRGLFTLDVASKRILREYALPHRSWVEDVSTSPDGKFVAVEYAPYGHETSIRFVMTLDLRTGKLVRLLKFPWYQFFYYPRAFRPDNRVLAVGNLNKVLLYDLYPSKSPLDPETIFGDCDPLDAMSWSQPIACQVLDREDEIASLGFSDNGKVLRVSTARGKAVVLSGNLRRVGSTTPPPAEFREQVRDVVISPDGCAIGILKDQSLLTWDVPARRKV